MPVRFRTFVTRLAVCGVLALGASCTAPAVPIPPPYTISFPDVNGDVSISGDAEALAVVLAFNETREEGVIGVADEEGRYQLTLQAESGDDIAVWQRVGTTDGTPRVQTVPSP